MFTGLVETAGTVREAVDVPPGRRLCLDWSPAPPLMLGESIAVNGCCLTVAALVKEGALFELGPETLARTNLGRIALGDRVNLERSLQVGDRLGGHFVTGHIDAVGTVAEWQASGEWISAWFDFPAALSGQLIPQGSIAVDGVSLTVVAVSDTRFQAMLIPHTLARTTLAEFAPGRRVNLETDLLAKYVSRALAVRP